MAISASKLVVEVEARTAAAAADLRRFSGQIDQTARGAQSAGKSFDSTSTQANKLGSAASRAGSQAQQAGQGFTQAASGAQKAGSSFASAGGAFSRLTKQMAQGATMGAGFMALSAGTTALSAGINFVADSAINMNARLEQSQVAFTTMLGSAEAASGFLQQLGDFAASTPFEFVELTEASQRLLAMGFAAEELIPLMTDIGNVSAGLGVGSVGIDRMVASLGQMEAKTRVQTEELLQLQELGVPALQILADAMGVTVAESQKMVSAGKVSSDVFIQAFQDWSQADFGGMMEAQSKTFSGAMSTITDSLQMGIAEGLEPFFALARDGAVELSTYLSGDEFDAFAAGVAEDMGTAATAVRDFVGDNREELLGFASDMAGAVQSTGEMVIGIGAVIERVDEVTGVFEQLTGTIGLVPKVVNIAVNLTEGTGSDAVVPEEIVANGVTVPVNIDDKSTGGGDGLLDTLMDTGKTQFVYTNTKMIIDGITWLDDTIQQANSSMSTEQVMAMAKAYELAHDPVFLLNMEMNASQEYSHEARMEWLAQKDALNEAATSMFNTAEAQAMSNLGTIESIGLGEQQLAMIHDLNSGNDAYAGSISSVAQAIDQEAIVSILAMQDAFAGLADSYQINLDVQKQFTSQGGEYASAQNLIEDALAGVQEKVEAGIELSQEEQLILDEGTAAIERYAGGQEDAEKQAALFAIANGKVMRAQDELNAAIERGDEDLGPYKDALKDAEGFLGDVETATGGTASAQDILADAINTNLVGAIDNLTRKVEYISKPWLIQIDAHTAAAEEAVSTLRGMIESGAIMPVSVVTGSTEMSGGVQREFAAGGPVKQDTLAKVGEEGWEYVLLPGGSHVYPHDESVLMEQMLGDVPGYAAGTPDNPVLGSGSSSVTATGFEQVGLDIGDQIMAGLMISLGPEAAADLMPGASAIADAMIQGAIVPIESEIEGVPDTWQVNMERIPVLAAGIGQETALALMEQYAELRGEMQLAILSGEDTGEIQAQLDAIEAMFEAWGQSAIGTATSVGDAMAAVAEAERFKGIFQLPSTPGSYSLDDIISGDAQASLHEDFMELWQMQDIAQDLGMDEWAAEIDKQMQDLGLDESFINAVINSETGQRLAENFAKEAAAANWDERFGEVAAGPDHGAGLQSEIADLDTKINMGIVAGTPADVIASWQEDKTALTAEMEQFWQDAALAAANGLLSPDVLEAYAEGGGAQFESYLEEIAGEGALDKLLPAIEQISAAGYEHLMGVFGQGPEMAGQFVDDVVLGLNEGSLDLEQAWGLLSQIPEKDLLPMIEDLEKKWTVELTQAWIDSDQEKIDSLNALLQMLGMVEGQIDAVAAAGHNWSSSGFGWISGPSGPVLPSGSGSSSLSSRSSGSSSGGGSTNFSSGDDDVGALMKKYPNLDWAGILAGEYGPGGLNAGSPTEAWVAAGLANSSVDVGTYSALRAFTVLLDEGLDIANNKTLFDRFEIAVKLVTDNADLLQDSLFMGALGIIGITEEAIRAAQTATKISKSERSTISEPIRVNDEGDVFIGISDRWADDLGFVGGNTKEGSGTRIPAFGNGSVIDHPLLALLGDKGPELAQPLAAGHPERARFIDDIADTVIQRMGNQPPIFMVDGQVFAGVTSKRVMHGVRAKVGS